VPGGPNDIIARAIGDRLAQAWDRSVVVENVPGAGGNIAGDRVAKAAPDGYTLLLANSTQVVVNPSLFEKMSYDPLKDLAPISQVASTPNVLTVPNDLPVRNVADLVALVRATPGKYTFGSAGVGTTQHLAGELFKSTARLDLQHTPIAARARSSRTCWAAASQCISAISRPCCRSSARASFTDWPSRRSTVLPPPRTCRRSPSRVFQAST
jgi:tripartite-type tricarboxylate transporter receptor subunit TctC